MNFSHLSFAERVGLRAQLITEQDRIEAMRLATLLVNPDNTIRSVPAAELAPFSTIQKALFGLGAALYQFPTTELTDYLRTAIGGRTAIEIGSGNGVIARELGIPGTDSYVQERPEIQAYFRSLGQAPMSYGRDVERLEAAEAVAKYRPEVAIGCWVTQKAGGNNTDGFFEGVNEIALLLAEGRHTVDEYILVGHDRVHGDKRLFSHPRIRVRRVQGPSWLVSRSTRPQHNAIWHVTRK